MGRIDRTPIAATSVLNGAFTDMLGAELPLVVPRLRVVPCWGDPEQPLYLTSKDDTAEVTAAVALQDDAPRILRLAGDVVSARDIACLATEISGSRHRLLRLGGIGVLSGLSCVTKALTPGSDDPFPPWPGMQYLRDMLSGRGALDPLANDDFPDIAWTSVRDVLAERLPVAHP